MHDYAQYDAVALADLIRRKAVSEQEVLDAALARADVLQGRLNAISTPCHEHARAALRAGLPDGPLRGVPFLLKDLQCLCKDTVSANGGRFFLDNRADHDCTLVARYKGAGLVIFGKTSTPEFGLTVTTEPKAFGAARNPWDPAFSTGGSSGGAAAAVAAGIVPVAHASDGGGSIRIPASICGVVGLKPTRARNPAGPDRGEGWAGMSHEHVVSRSVRDSAALLDLSAGPDLGAPYFAERPKRPFLAEVGADPGRLRVGLLLHTPAGEALHPECAQAARDTAVLLTALGHTIEEVKVRALPGEFMPALRAVIAGHVRAAVDAHAVAKGKRPSPDQFEHVTWSYYESGGRLSAGEYAQAVFAIHRCGRHVAGWFENVDLLLSPTLPDPPSRLGVFNMDSQVDAEYMRAVARLTAFTVGFNASGAPAISLPMHWTPEGLPVGVQLAAPYGEEALLLRVAAQLEAAKPWRDRRPNL